MFRFQIKLIIPRPFANHIFTHGYGTIASTAWLQKPSLHYRFAMVSYFHSHTRDENKEQEKGTATAVFLLKLAIER